MGEEMATRGPQSYKMDEFDAAVCKALLALGYPQFCIAQFFCVNSGRINETGMGHEHRNPNASVLEVIGALNQFVIDGGDPKKPLVDGNEAQEPEKPSGPLAHLRRPSVSDPPRPA